MKKKQPYLHLQLEPQSQLDPQLQDILDRVLVWNRQLDQESQSRKQKKSFELVDEHTGPQHWFL